MTTLVDLAAAVLIRAETAGSLAVCLVLTLRLPARRAFGAEAAYRLWALPPAIAALSLFPSFSDFFGPVVSNADASIPHSGLILQVWAAGVVGAAAVMATSEAAFRRKALQGRAGPAVMGVLWPRLVTPSDFAERFTPVEQALVRRHEATHIALGHPMSNLVIAAAQVLSWFNPLIYMAAACARLDQELACDAVVVAAQPESRRLYGETLLKAHMQSPRSPFACAWSALGRHPLETRLATLAGRPVTLALYLRGAAAVALVGALTAVSIWGAGPRWADEPRFVWPSWTPAQASADLAR
jgi:beta-lactamase regulating signal transducer with metallopeptidase domain